MKRNKRMLDIGILTDRMTHQNDHPSFRAALVEAMPARVLGPVIAGHIDKVTISEKRLVLKVSEVPWRREVMAHREMLLFEARKLLKDIVVVQIEP